jgi:eukaryotic-like serine/threonine-protein kinase
MSRSPGPPADDDRDLAEDVPETTFRPGDLLCDRFRVVRFIARGGMGEVYEADDLELKERIALKAIRPDIAAEERVNQRFRREVQLARRVTHPNICRVFDLFQHQSANSRQPATLFVTMELLQGETLSQRLKREGRLSPEAARPIVEQMSAALSSAHAAGVIHRDFKSSNVMLTTSDVPGAPPRVVVTDFGLAFNATDSGRVSRAASMSLTGEILGTPDYMAPEQVEGGVVTPATDIYALGIVMYEMVTGVRPFTADTPIQSALKRISGPPPTAPREIVDGLSASWNGAIMRCLARYPASRFSDAQDVVRAIERSHSLARRGARWVAAILILAAAGGLGAVIVQQLQQRAVSPLGSAADVPALRQAVAVLGFRNLAGRQDAQWLSTAFAEMLTTELGAGSVLRTIPGENVDRMKVELALGDADAYGADTLARIQRNLGADIVVFGSYVAVGGGDAANVRLDIRLQRSSGDTVAVVSESGTVGEILTLVSRAGAQMRQQLGVTTLLAGDAASVRATQPSSADVARLYSQGLARLRRFDALGARDVLEQAVAADASFPLTHSALARAWAALGYDARAREEAERAFTLGTNLGRADKLIVEGTYREMTSAWTEAVSIWQTLSTFFPDDIEFVLRLANAQIASGAPKVALQTIERFRTQFPALADPRLDLAEANAAEILSDFKRMQAAGSAAVTTAQAQGATLLVAAARLREGGALLRQGQRDLAIKHFQEARQLYARAGDRAAEARALNNLAGALSDGPGADKAVAMYEQGLATARAIGEQNLVARFLNNLAIQKRRAGDFQASLTMNQESLAIRREIGDRANELISLNNIGNVLLDLGDLDGAAQHYQQSAEMSRAIGDRRGLARALYNAAEALRLQGEVARARAVGEEALQIRRGIDDPASVATSLFGLGHTADLQGDLPTARRLLTEVLAMERKLDRQRPIAYALYQLGEVALVEGNFAEAKRLHEEALALRITIGEQQTASESRAALAVLALEEGRSADAERMSNEAAAAFEAEKARGNEASARAIRALALARLGKRAQAERDLTRARALSRDLQNVIARFPVQIVTATLEADTNPLAARRALEAIREDAVRRGMPRFEYMARRAMVEIEQRTSLATAAESLAQLRADARGKGFLLFAR